MDPIKTLKHEHRIIERVLHALDSLCLHLENGEPVPADALAQPIDFIRTFADGCHHKKEETHLFPALEQRGIPRAGGPLGVMMGEHEIGRVLIAELDLAVQGYRRADGDARRRFVDLAREYIELLTLHIRKEEDILFEIADAMLDEKTRASLGKAFEQAEMDLGAGTHEQLEQIAADLETRWAAPVGSSHGHSR